jgi:isopenicillin-N epimerase
VDLSDIGCDFYSGNLHKWLCAPKGSAFLYANLNVQPMLQPLVVSWGWMSDHPGHSHFLDLFEWTGTRDISAYLAVPDAIHFQQDNHWDAVRSACHQMASDTLMRLTQLTGLQPLYPDSTTWFGQMVAAQLPSTLDIDILKGRLYDDYSIEVPISTWKDKNLIRVSYQGYNESRDIDRLVEALAQLI